VERDFLTIARLDEVEGREESGAKKEEVKEGREWKQAKETKGTDKD